MFILLFFKHIYGTFNSCLLLYIGQIMTNQAVVSDLKKYKFYWIISKQVRGDVDRGIVWVYGWSPQPIVGLIERGKRKKKTIHHSAKDCNGIIR